MQKPEHFVQNSRLSSFLGKKQKFWQHLASIPTWQQTIC